MTGIDFAIDDGIASLRLSRPDQRNALSTSLLGAARDVLRDLRDDPSVRALVLSAAGDAFCAGADLAEIAPDAPANIGIRRIRLVTDVLEALRNLDVPTVAAVQGPAIGAGWGLALMCDCCFASAEAEFALPEIPKGFRLPSPIVRRLVDIAGPVRAADMVLTGRRLDASEALAIGVVSRIVDRSQLFDVARGAVAHLASREPQRVSATTAALRAGDGARRGASEFMWINEGKE